MTLSLTADHRGPLHKLPYRSHGLKENLSFFVVVFFLTYASPSCRSILNKLVFQIKKKKRTKQEEQPREIIRTKLVGGRAFVFKTKESRVLGKVLHLTYLFRMQGQKWVLYLIFKIYTKEQNSPSPIKVINRIFSSNFKVTLFLLNLSFDSMSCIFVSTFLMTMKHDRLSSL